MKWTVGIGIAVGLLSLVGLAACGKREPPEAMASTTGPTGSGATSSFTPAPAPAGEFNAAQIDWQPYDVAMKTAQRDQKPVCLIVSATWCPHCKNFSRVFNDPRVVERARDFVMVHLDADAQSDVAAKYAVDGTYVPRTFFLGADGHVATSVHPTRPRFLYFYDERDPASLLDGMATALRTLHGS